jgi:hypothetical protein
MAFDLCKYNKYQPGIESLRLQEIVTLDGITSFLIETRLLLHSEFTRIAKKTEFRRNSVKRAVYWHLLGTWNRSTWAIRYQ